MIRRTVYIADWRVDVFIDDDGKPDIAAVEDCMREMGAPRSIMRRSTALMEDAIPNEAFTYSNGRRTCMYIGRTTSGKEFQNSIVHEIRHLIDQMAGHRGADAETAGYLSGEAAFLLAEDICRMGCGHCREEKENENKNI